MGHRCHWKANRSCDGSGTEWDYHGSLAREAQVEKPPLHILATWLRYTKNVGRQHVRTRIVLLLESLNPNPSTLTLPLQTRGQWVSISSFGQMVMLARDR